MEIAFFHAVLESSPDLLKKYDAQSLRKEVCDFIMDNQELDIIESKHGNATLKSLYTEKDVGFSFDKRVSKLRRNGEYADIVCLYAVANLFQVALSVLDTQT